MRPHLSFPYRFRPSTLQRVFVLKALLNLIFSYILPPFLQYFPRDKLKLSHYAEVHPGFVQNHLGFGGLRPSRFILIPPKAGRLRNLIISCSLLEKSKSGRQQGEKRFQERQKTKNHSDQQENHLKASFRHVVYSRLSVLQPGRVILISSPFSDSIVFAVHTRKTAFSKCTVFKSFHFGECFRIDPFSLIVFGVLVWTVAVSGTKQYRFRLKTV